MTHKFKPPLIVGKTAIYSVNPSEKEISVICYIEPPIKTDPDSQLSLTKELSERTKIAVLYLYYEGYIDLIEDHTQWKTTIGVFNGKMPIFNK